MAFLLPAAATAGATATGTAAATATVGSTLMTALPYVLAGATIYQAQQNIAIGNQQAAYSQMQADMAQDAYAIRKEARKKDLAKKVGQQKTLYSVSGVDIFEGTPVDVFTDTAASYGYEQFSDAYDTMGQIYGYEESARIAKQEGKQRAFGNLLDYGLTFARRG
jgi:hypothetical protein